MRDHIARRLKEEHGRIREPKAHPAPPPPARWETRDRLSRRGAANGSTTSS